MTAWKLHSELAETGQPVNWEPTPQREQEPMEDLLAVSVILMPYQEFLRA